MKSLKKIFIGQGQSSSGGRTGTQKLTNEADRMFNVIYLTTECSTRTVHRECDSLRRTNINPLRTRWVIELGMKTQTVGERRTGEWGGKKVAQHGHFQRSRGQHRRFDWTSDMTKQRSLDTPGRRDMAQVRKSKRKQSGRREWLRRDTGFDY